MGLSEVTRLPMKFSLKRIVRPLAILAVGVLIAIVMVASNKPMISAPAKDNIAYVETKTIEVGKQDIIISARGNHISTQDLSLSSEVAGSVIWVSQKFNEGEFFLKGDVILKVNPIPYELALAQAKATLETAKVALSDAKALQRTARIEEAKANINAAEKLVLKAQQDLEKTVIVAPFNAVVDSKSAELGQYLTPGKVVARLFGTDKGEIHLPLVQADAYYLSQHYSANVVVRRVVAGKELTWLGKFSRLEGRMDTNTRVLNAVVVIDEPYNTLKQELPLVFGAFVDVDLKGEPVADASSVPQIAIHAGNYIYVYEDGVLHKRQIELIHANNNGDAIIQGLTQGDRVVINRLDVMYDSMRVAVNDE